ncbi:hypothetical protein HCN44_000441 [Aphidius gifuensis]|uniref:C2 domain-containing protein n=1 Tax=Aphidius gifuensis TaxID=684658 RepID=A0A834XR09_APHGI|nr:hypothetical protein HCN44_000441 [Aphidius gifuensis]
MLYTGTFISSIGTGMANALYLYVTETAAPHQRAWLASSGPILVSLGVLGSYVLGALTTWQYTAAISIILSILSVALVKFLPESPAWLARHGHLNEAKKSLLWLRGPGISYENEYKELCDDASIERRKKNSKIILKTAFLLLNVWKPFLILIIFFCLQQLSDAHRLPYKLVPNPFIIIVLNNVKVARTKIKTGTQPLWDEEFILEDIPSDVMSFSLTLYNHGKRSKDTEVAEVIVELTNLPNGEEIDGWYPLVGATPIGEWGALHLRIRYRNDLAMPLEEYSPLQQLLLDPELQFFLCRK